MGRLSVASILLLANGNPARPTVGGGHVAIVWREKEAEMVQAVETFGQRRRREEGRREKKRGRGDGFWVIGQLVGGSDRVGRFGTVVWMRRE